MTIKITTPNGGSDSLDFGCAQTAIVATVTGTEVSSGEGKLEFKTTTGGTSATKATVLANGDVGIGTTAPMSDLHLGSSNAQPSTSGDMANNGLTVSNGSGGRAIQIGVDDTNSRSYIQAGYVNNANTANHLSFLSGATESMRITSAGDVGIGTTAPAKKLEIVDTSSGASKDALLLTNYGAASNTETGIFFSPTEADGAIRGARISALNDGANDSNSVALKFSTGLGAPPVERMRVTSAGNVLVGTTTLIGDSSRLNISYTYTNSGIGLKSNTASAHNAIMFTNTNGTVGTITTSGSSTAYNTSSDYRLKENVQYEWSATERLKKLKPAQFNFLSDPDNTVDGFLAHEAQEVVPEAVTGVKDEVDDDDKPVMQGIDQSKLVPLLVKTIQELEARIAKLEEDK